MKDLKLYPLQQILIPNIADIPSFKLLVHSIVTLGVCSGLAIPVSAQVTAGVDGTVVNQTNGTFDITGGKQSASGTNLFHSFGKFDLNMNQVANFVQPNASVQNILGRIDSRLPSSIDGTIKVTGVDSSQVVNLYLMNPAGIVFGKNASLNINGAFTATTAKAIDFGNGNWFNALGTNTYTELKGNPIGLAFPGSTPGSIFSAANLTAKPGQSITLVGGTVISTGDIKTAGGNISIATVEGGKYVEIKAEGNILGMILPISTDNNINGEAKSFTALSLPGLLTATKPDLVATGVKIEGDVVTLVGNPAANALVPELNKAVSAFQEARAALDKARADSRITPNDDNTRTALNSALAKYDSSQDSLNNIQKKFDSLAALGEPKLVSDAIAAGDTISKQDRPIVSGDIIMRNLDTSNPVKGGNIHIESSNTIVAGNIKTVGIATQKQLRNTGGIVVLQAETDIKTERINSSTRPDYLDSPNSFGPRKITFPTKAGNVTLVTKTGDIIVDGIDTRGDAITGSDKPIGGDLKVKVEANRLFRVIKEGINVVPFGKLDINYGGTAFVTGVTVRELTPEERFKPGADSETRLEILPIPGFKFPEKASGSRGPIVASISNNGSVSVVYTSEGFFGDGSKIQQSTVTTKLEPNKTEPNKTEPNKTEPNKTDPNKTDPNKTDPNEQAAKQKSKQDCTPSSTSVAANSTTDPNRAAGDASTPSGDPCQLVTGTAGGTLQILNDKN